MTLFAFAAAWLLRAQFTSSRRLRDLLLVGAALALGLTNLWASALPAAMDEGARSSFSSAELWGQIGGGAILAAAAFTRPDRLVIRSRRPVVIIGLLVLGALAVSGLGALLWAAQSGAGSPGHMLSRPWVPLLVFAAAGPMAYAAAAFTRRRQQEGDRTATLLALAALLLASATASDLLTRSLPAGTIGADDGLRLIAFSLILAAAVVLERRVRRRLAKSAALAERRRVARDLHDGLAQDLAFIAAHGPSIAQEMGDRASGRGRGAPGACHLAQHDLRAGGSRRCHGARVSGGRRARAARPVRRHDRRRRPTGRRYRVARAGALEPHRARGDRQRCPARARPERGRFAPPRGARGRPARRRRRMRHRED